MVPRALIAEDDPDLVQLMSAFLRDHGFDVTAAVDGHEAKECLAAKAIDVAVIDVGLPRTSGLELLQHIRRERPDVPIVVISGSAEHGPTALELGAEAFLVKPVPPTLILSALGPARRYAEALAAERRSVAVAEQALHMNRELIASITHDLRNPINVLRLNLSAFVKELSVELGKPPSPRMLRKLEMTDRAVTTMEKLVGGLLDQMTFEQGSLQLVRSPTDVNRLVSEFVEAHSNLAAARGIRLVLEVSPQPLVVSCDPDRIERVLANLGSNAFKHVPTGGEIRLRTERVEGGARFTMSDSGPGVPPDQLDAIFGRHWQARPTATGVGLGLYIARGLVEAHGGRIWCESGAERGAKFVFTSRSRQRGRDPATVFGQDPRLHRLRRAHPRGARTLRRVRPQARSSIGRAVGRQSARGVGAFNDASHHGRPRNTSAPPTGRESRDGAPVQ